MDHPYHHSNNKIVQGLISITVVIRDRIIEPKVGTVCQLENVDIEVHNKIFEEELHLQMQMKELQQITMKKLIRTYIEIAITANIKKQA